MGLSQNLIITGITLIGTGLFCVLLDGESLRIKIRASALYLIIVGSVLVGIGVLINVKGVLFS